MNVPSVLVTGPVGVGKTAVALEAGELLARAAIPHAVVDLDALAWCYPRPEDDQFNKRLAFRNLAAVWANYTVAGAKRLIIARVIETRAELGAYCEAIPGAEITIVRLRASQATLRKRIVRRELGTGQKWLLNRSVELASLMDQEAVEDHLIETDDRGVTDVAQAMLRQIRWL